MGHRKRSLKEHGESNLICLGRDASPVAESGGGSGGPDGSVHRSKKARKQREGSKVSQLGDECDAIVVRCWPKTSLEGERWGGAACTVPCAAHLWPASF